jgi:hypothetical protein
MRCDRLEFQEKHNHETKRADRDDYGVAVGGTGVFVGGAGG